MNQCENQVRAIKKMCAMSTLLPAEYQQVEYLQSSGTQYIVTSMPIYNGLETHCTGMFTDTNIDLVALVGGRNNNSGNGRYIPFSLTDGQYLRFAFGNSGLTSTYDAYELHSIVFNDYQKKVYIDNVQVMDLTGTTVNTSRQQKVVFFGMSGYNDATVDWKASGRLYSVSFYDTLFGSKTGEYVPCYRKSDHKPGMYDLVTKTFFTNDGTGEFTVGNNV